jgi:hypothetical protein
MEKAEGGLLSEAERILDLTRRVEGLEKVFAAGDADRPLDFMETCARATTRSPETVRTWWKHKATRKVYRLDVLFTKDVGGRLVSSPRAVARWHSAMRRASTAGAP